MANNKPARLGKAFREIQHTNSHSLASSQGSGITTYGPIEEIARLAYDAIRLVRLSVVEDEIIRENQLSDLEDRCQKLIKWRLATNG